MAKLAKPKAKDKPATPKKPSTRSKTGNAACSEAASNWQLSLRGKAALSPDTYQTLAKCRAMNRTAKMAEGQGRTGKLSTMGEQAVKARLQARFDSGLITQKARTERLDMLLKQRSEKQAEAFTETVRKSTPIKSYANYTSSGIKKIEDAAANSSNAAYRQKLEATAFEARMERQGEARYRLGIRDQRAIDWDQRERSLAIAAKVTYPKKLPGQLGLGFDVQPPTQPTAIVPTQPARYSLGGKLAPGRGTEERKAEAAFRLAVRSGDAKKIAASGNKRGKLQGSKVKYRDTSWSDSTTQIRQVSVGRNQSTATRVNVEDLQIEIRNRTRYRQKTGKLTIQPKPIPIIATFDASTTVDRNGREIRGYVARLTGTDPKYKLKREFINIPTGGILTTSERGMYESRGPSASVFGIDRANKPTEKNYVLIGRRKVRNLVDFQAERAVRLMERFRSN